MNADKKLTHQEVNNASHTGEISPAAPNYFIGLDVGGSHVSANKLGNMPQDAIHATLESHNPATSIINTISAVIKKFAVQDTDTIAVGIAIPGPFNYEKGISEIHGVGGKFSNAFGLNIAEALKTFAQLPPGSEIHFANDAHCFATGAYHLLKLQSNRSICITLGTGFGSAFLQNGKLIQEHENIPASGAFYCEPFKKSIADDYFSSRWLLNEYKSITGENIESVKKLAALTDKEQQAKNIFETFGENMADFLAVWLKKYDCDTLVLGGNISKAWHLFGETFTNSLAAKNCNSKVLVCEDTEECIITGAALLAEEKTTSTNKMAKIDSFRKTSQTLLPLCYNNPQKGYDIFPSFQLSYGKIETGFDELTKQIASQKIIVIDGFGGVLWDAFRAHLNTALIAQGIKTLWYDISACLKPETVVNEMLKDNLNGNDPVFGKRFTGKLIDFFDKEKLALLQSDDTADTCIVYGTGAALSNWKGLLIYLDIPKNEIQYRMRAKSICNLGTTQVEDDAQMYKRFYFADWPVLNKHKQVLLKEIEIIVDEQRVDEIAWMSGADFRRALDEMLVQPLRARPWFEAGIWGGNWMKEKITDLVQDEINYAWSFELITPENGIVLSHHNVLLEVSFDFLLFYNNEKLLGKAAKRFGTDFPIRFDFLDTFDGGNLSIQCHPRTDYVKEKFGEKFTQDETYYILDCKPDAKVYLGFQENIEPRKFKQALIDSQEKGLEINAEDYVQSFPAHKHDLFLIPNGTVHASGKNNMVLEISSTPYIFTFKMYDWQRLDLAGKPRPINIEHAFNNLYFYRKGKVIEETLISKPRLLSEGKNYKRFELPTHAEHFYAIERFEFTGEINIVTNNQCHICMLVEGESVDVTVHKSSHHFTYAETFLIPAAANNYVLKSNAVNKAMLVIAYVKDGCC
jgi:predicted NBD/HSP70 family sugar kinase/mannose-6-phosphate isomerase class I/RNA polymerase subunit RPABC4/transcription elongation factor Spt4